MLAVRLRITEMVRKMSDLRRMEHNGRRNQRKRESCACRKRKVASAVSSPYSITEITTENEHRYDTGCGELNRVLGGGIVKGSLILLGGDPGIGKSTVLLQICQYLGNSMKVLYVSGEESQRQLKLRANRLGVNSPNLL